MGSEQSLGDALESGRRWFEAYAHETDVEKAVALVDACAYCHLVSETALDARDQANAEVERLRANLLIIAQSTALSAETHRLMAQDVLGGFAERGEGGD